jgi:tetraacyldisaccharide 4'-kinase
MVEFLGEHLQAEYKIAILSRGYKRKTRGYALADERSTALTIGDEPMQFKNKFPGLVIAVGEERLVAIPQLLHDRPEIQVVIMDDAFQHRSVAAGYNILLTEYDNLYTRDWYLPTGDLRDNPSSVSRANVIVVTKCPADLSPEEANAIRIELGEREGRPVYFTLLQYGIPYHIMGRHELPLNSKREVLLVTGIANPMPLKKYLNEKARTYYEMLFGDHHIFTIDDWREITRRFRSITAADKIMLTTEKDAVRLLKFGTEIADYPLFVLPIRVQFLFGAEQHFLSGVRGFIGSHELSKNNVHE